METRANYVTVGIFTLVAILSAFAFVYWTAAVGDRGEVARLRILIPGSASGLSRGSAILFNGVRVGTIDRVYIDPRNPAAAIADAQIDRATPITASTEVDVGLAGLTGQANIELRGANLDEPNLLDLAEQRGEIAELTANPSAVTNLLETAQSIFRRADNVLTEFEGFATDVRGPLTESARNAQEFSEALGRNAEGIDTFLSSVSELSGTLASVSGQLESTLGAAEELISAVDAERINRAVGNVEEFTAELNEAGDGLQGILANVEGASQSISGLAESAGATMTRIEGIVDNVDAIVGRVEPQVVADLLANASNAARTIDTAAGEITRITQSLVDALDPERVDRVAGNVETLTADLSSAGEGLDAIMADVGRAASSIALFGETAGGTLARVDGVVENVQTILAGIEPEQIGEIVSNFELASDTIREAAADVSRVAETVGARSEDIDTIISDARQLSDRLNVASVRVNSVLERIDDLLGSGEAEGVIADTRETLESFRRLADNLNAKIDEVLGSEETEGLVTDARETLVAFREMANTIDERVEAVLGSEQTEGLIADASATLAAYRRVAETVNARVGVIADDFAQFSGQGLQEFEALVREARRAITRIERAITDLERNPQRILQGGAGTVREYDGRQRR